jgi:RNA polymerase sigma factor (sigma-70 family)
LMTTYKTRMDRIIDRVIRRAGLLVWMELEDARQTLHVEARVAWRSPEDQPDALVFCVLYRRAVDAIRHQQRYFPRNLEAFEEETTWSEEVAWLDREARSTSEQRAMVRQVLALIEAPGVLSVREQTYLRASLDGDTQEEIAVDSGISRTRVQQVVAEAIDKVRRRL